MTLKSDSSSAAVEIVLGPGEQPSLHTFLHEGEKDGVGAGQLKSLLQVEDDYQCGAMIGLRQEGDIAVRYAYYARIAKHVRMEVTHAPLHTVDEPAPWPVLAMQLVREMVLSFPGSLGFGIGCMSASFNAGGRRPASQDALSRDSTAPPSACRHAPASGTPTPFAPITV